MGFLSSLSRKLGFTGGDEDEREEELEENELEEDEEEEEEEESTFSFKFPFGNAKRNRQQNAAYDEEEEEEPNIQTRREPQGGYSSRKGNVIHDSRMDPRAAHEVVFTHCERIVNVRQIEECREIIRHLLHGESVLLNLENIDPKDCGRVVDLLSGAAFALQGRMIKVAHLSYLLAPENVEIIEEDVYSTGHVRYR